MTKEIPEINDLIKGINDSDLTLTDGLQVLSGSTGKESEVSLEKKAEKDSNSTSIINSDKCWQVFMDYLDTSDERNNKDERLVCKLDRDLADSLDDCDIHNRSRSDMVNAIVRAFFETYLPQLSDFRRKKQSLFATSNKDDYEME